MTTAKMNEADDRREPVDEGDAPRLAARRRRQPGDQDRAQRGDCARQQPYDDELDPLRPAHFAEPYSIVTNRQRRTVKLGFSLSQTIRDQRLTSAPRPSSRPVERSISMPPGQASRLPRRRSRRRSVAAAGGRAGKGSHASSPGARSPAATATPASSSRSPSRPRR